MWTWSENSVAVHNGTHSTRVLERLSRVLHKTLYDTPPPPPISPVPVLQWLTCFFYPSLAPTVPLNPPATLSHRRHHTSRLFSLSVSRFLYPVSMTLLFLTIQYPGLLGQFIASHLSTHHQVGLWSPEFIGFYFLVFSFVEFSILCHLLFFRIERVFSFSPPT